MLSWRGDAGGGKRNSSFVWNDFMLLPLTQAVENRDPSAPWLAGRQSPWVLPLIHGFLEQVRCSVFGRSVTVTLISRRSRQFAGTRYLKRGINDYGFTANDVDTEQIVHDRCGGDPVWGQFASYAQMRASVPLFWSQESNAMIAKPPILIQKYDPVHRALRSHFS
eukprot:GABV01001655.1.p1 GENE.GABV01001655.1~~GABV01001655.1.p1  ORF type:complete len:165 (+),score=42.41 GABV01001655.1:338-832(+)